MCEMCSLRGAREGLRRGVGILPEARFWVWRLLWLEGSLRRGRAVLRIEVLVRDADCGAWPSSDGLAVTSEGTVVAGELRSAE